MLKKLTILALLLCISGVARAQNHVQTLSVTNSPLTITADGNYNQVLIRENSASPTAVFSITLAGSSTAINFPAGTQFIFYGNFVSGQALGTIVATTSGPFSFVAVEAVGTVSQSAKNSGVSGSATVTTASCSPLQLQAQIRYLRAALDRLPQQLFAQSQCFPFRLRPQFSES